MATPSAFAHMKMNDVNTDTGSGANAVSDIGTPTYAGGKINNALSLDGSTDALNLDALLADIITDTIGSIAFWFYADDQIADQMIFTVSNGSAVGGSLQLDYHGGNLKCYYNTGVGAVTQWGALTSPLAATTWHHIVLVQDGVSPKVYVNGVDDTLLSPTVDTTKWLSADSGNLTSARIGAQDFNGGGETFWFAGKIDDFRYYKAVLTQEDVSNLYRGGVGTEDDPPPFFSLGFPHSQAFIIS